MGGRTLTFTKEWANFLNDIEMFLTNHPDEIITLCLESYVGDYNKIIRDIVSAKLDKHLYSLPAGSSKWEKRDGMIMGSKGRLLIFSDSDTDCGPGIMNAKYYILENHYDYDECLYRDFLRLKLPVKCNSSPGNTGVFQCIKGEMAQNPVGGVANNKGAIIFLLNHFQITEQNHLFKRLFPIEGNNVIRNRYQILNSYDTIRNRIRQCYCEFEVKINSQSIIMKLEAYPSIIALDFIGEENAADEGVRGIIRDMLLGNFTILAC